jgi:hypothetical protein
MVTSGKLEFKKKETAPVTKESVGVEFNFHLRFAQRFHFSPQHESKGRYSV